MGSLPTLGRTGNQVYRANISSSGTGIDEPHRCISTDLETVLCENASPSTKALRLSLDVYFKSL